MLCRSPVPCWQSCGLPHQQCGSALGTDWCAAVQVQLATGAAFGAAGAFVSALAIPLLSWHPTTLLSIDSLFALFLTLSAAGAARPFAIYCTAFISSSWTSTPECCLTQCHRLLRRALRLILLLAFSHS